MNNLRIIKAKNTDYSNYNKIVFVDASGDDGFVFDNEKGNNSSSIFLVSAFMTTPDNIEHNNTVLNSIKDELNLPHSQELKSTTLKRHRFSSQAYECFSNLHGVAFSEIAFKEKLLKEKKKNKDKSFYALLVENEKKQLSGLLHSFPFYALEQLELLNANDKVLIVFDNMKTIEEKSVLAELKNFVSQNIKYDILFADSKDDRFSLIQIADAICGTVRDFFENEKYSRNFKMCSMCKIRMMQCFKTPTGQKRLRKVKINKNHSIILDLHSREETASFSANHMFTIPSEVYNNYYFLHCASNKKRS